MGGQDKPMPFEGLEGDGQKGLRERLFPPRLCNRAMFKGRLITSQSALFI